MPPSCSKRGRLEPALVGKRVELLAPGESVVIIASGTARGDDAQLCDQTLYAALTLAKATAIFGRVGWV